MKRKYHVSSEINPHGQTFTRKRDAVREMKRLNKPYVQSLDCDGIETDESTIYSYYDCEVYEDGVLVGSLESDGYLSRV